MLNLVSLSTQSLASCVNYFVWNCLTCFSNTKIGSVTSFSILFNFQGPVRLSLAADDLIILPQKWFFVKHFFRYFFEPSKRLFKSFPPARCSVPRCVFAGTSLLFGFWRAAVLRDSLFIIPHFCLKSTPFFYFFYNFFDLFLGRVHMDALTWFLYSIKFNPLSIPYSSPMSPYTL